MPVPVSCRWNSPQSLLCSTNIMGRGVGVGAGGQGGWGRGRGRGGGGGGERDCWQGKGCTRPAPKLEKCVRSAPVCKRCAEWRCWPCAGGGAGGGGRVRTGAGSGSWRGRAGRCQRNPPTCAGAQQRQPWERVLDFEDEPQPCAGLNRPLSSRWKGGAAPARTAHSRRRGNCFGLPPHPPFPASPKAHRTMASASLSMKSALAPVVRLAAVPKVS